MSTHFSRRDVLKRTVFATVAFSMPSFLLSACKTSCPTPPPIVSSIRKRVIVVGAGLAGLSSAYILSQAGYDVVVLEARNRPGGRVLTLRDSFTDGQFADAGAFFISDRHKKTNDYVEHFGLTKVSLLPDNLPLRFYVQGKCHDVHWANTLPANLFPIPVPEKSFGDIVAKYVSKPLDALDPTKWDLPMTGGSLLGIKNYDYDAMSLNEFLDSLKPSPNTRTLLNLWFAGWWGDLNEVSAAAVLRDAQIAMVANHWYTIREGMDSLPKAFELQLAREIRYNAPVIAISHDDEQSVTATYRGASGERQERGDYLICTTPFPVLKNMKILQDTKYFTFSQKKRNAIQQLGYASIARVFLQFNKKAWAGSNGMTLTDLQVMNLVDSTFADQAGSKPHTSCGILHAYLCGPNVQQLKKEPDRISAVRLHMEAVYPELKGKFTGHGAAKFWDDDDEWAQGAFAVFKKGEMTTLMPHIATPERHVFFAGDHTSSMPGWMEGALESGHRVAGEIMQQAPSGAAKPSS